MSVEPIDDELEDVDAIAGPVIRGGARHGIRTPATEELRRRVAARARVED